MTMTPINFPLYRAKGPDSNKDKSANDIIKTNTLENGFSLSGKLEKFSRANAVEQLKLFSGIIKLSECTQYFKNQVEMENIQLPMGEAPGGKRTVIDPEAKLFRPVDLSPLIISSGSGAGPYLSTDRTMACGGYASKRYLYKIDLAGSLSQYDWKDVLPSTLGKQTAFWPKLLLITGKTLEESEIIAVAHQSGLKEVTFLTPIPAIYHEHRIISLCPVDPEIGNITTQ